MWSRSWLERASGRSWVTVRVGERREEGREWSAGIGGGKCGLQRGVSGLTEWIVLAVRDPGNSDWCAGGYVHNWCSRGRVVGKGFNKLLLVN